MTEVNAGNNTGAGAQASMPSAPELERYFTQRWLEAKQRLHLAEHAMQLASAELAAVKDGVPAGERLRMAMTAEASAEIAQANANAVSTVLGVIRAGHGPRDGLAQLVTPPLAIISIRIERDAIQQTAHLMMGRRYSASRTWDRTGRGSWKTRNPEWMNQEQWLGVELCEYLDAMDLPGRVANMLPHAAGTDAAFRAAQEVCHG